MHTFLDAVLFSRASGYFQDAGLLFVYWIYYLFNPRWREIRESEIAHSTWNVFN